MKRILKSSLSLVLALTIILSSALVGLGVIDFGEFFAVKAEAASESDLTFVLNADGESYSVTNCSSSASGELVIPSTYNGLPVTSIGDYAFYDCTRLTSVTIHHSVTSVGSGAFEGCTSLTSVHITDIASWCNISFDSFYSNPLEYAKNLYLNGELVTDLVIPDSVTSIGGYAFRDCTSLTSITIPDSVTSIGGYAFRDCTSLTSVTIPNSVTSIGSGAFYNTAYYNNSSNWVNDVLYIGNHLIEAKDTINGDYIIKDGTKTIAAAAFSGCSSLTSITIPNSVTSIGASAFRVCRSLTSVTIPDSVTSIGGYAFYNTAYYNNSSNWVNDVLYIGNHLIEAKETINGGYIIKYGTKTIADHAFYDCTSLTSVTIGNSVTSIGGYAFYDCTSLTSVTIPNSVTSIGDSAFGYYSYEQNKVNGFTINGYKGSAAEKYANANGFTFFDLQTKPKLTKIENASNGIKITWGKVTGAQSYNVYRKTYSNGKWSGWSTIKTGATGTTYTDTTAKSGTYYRYTVRAKNEAGLSGYNSTGLKIKFLATPKLSSVSNGSGKVTVKWSKVAGASSYTVYRKTYSNGKWSGWSKIGTTKKTYYNDAKVSSSKNYKYTVRATSGDYRSYYNTSGIQIKYLAGPKISSASSRREGILINWNKITGASGYYVYRKTSSGDWKKIATVKGNTKIKYLDETPRKGVTYQYRVKAYSGKYTSTYGNTYKIKCKY